MEFYEFFELIYKYVPDSYPAVKNTMQIMLPVLFAIFTGLSCFFGHFVHKIWNAFFFFGLGFISLLFIFFAIFEPQNTAFWILVFICAAIGIVCAYYSKQLLKTQIFITTFLMVFIAVPDYFSFLGNTASVFIGLALALAASLLSIKYKYITIIFTTAFSGALMLWNIIENTFELNHTLTVIFALLTGIAGLAVQCYVERNELKKTYDEIKEKSKKARKKSSETNIENSYK